MLIRKGKHSKAIRIIVSLLLCSCLLLGSSLPAMASDTVITASSANGNIGDTVSIDISIQNNPSISGGQFDMLYDPAIADVLNITDIKRGTLLSDGDAFIFVKNNKKAPNTLSIAWAAQGSPTPTITQDGIICTITFTLKAAGTANLTLQNIVLKAPALNTVQVTPVSGTVTVAGSTASESTTAAPTTNSQNQDPTPVVNPQPTTPVIPEPVASTVQLSDVNNHWAKSYITQLTSRKIISGYPDGTFLPDNNITRAEFTKIIVGAMGLTVQADANLKFADKDSIDAWARPYVAAAVQAGILNGYDDNTFQASNNISRAEMAVMVVNAMKKTPATNPQLSFADSSSVPTWAAGFIKTAYDNGIIKGKDANVFAPNDSATRAEAATMTVNMLNSLGI